MKNNEVIVKPAHFDSDMYGSHCQVVQVSKNTSETTKN